MVSAATKMNPTMEELLKDKHGSSYGRATERQRKMIGGGRDGYGRGVEDSGRRQTMVESERRKHVRSRPRTKRKRFKT
jgi:hypothetical protein